jgi:hypothetical protein
MLRGFMIAGIGLALAACASTPLAEDVVLETSQASVLTRIGEDGVPTAWNLAPELNPDVFEAGVPEGQSRDVCFTSERDEKCFDIRAGDVRDFVILRDGVRHNTRITGVVRVPAAVFSADYQATHRGRTEVLVPEVYELVNIAIAMTPFAAENQGLVITDTEYYARVQAHFGAYRDHPLVRAMDTEMRANVYAYFRNKMNGYAFEFDEGGAIVRSRIYDRTGFDDDTTNTMLPHLAEMQSFADATGFRAFYAGERAFYESQIAYLRDNSDTAGITSWLQGNFPGVRAYDGVKIIFSPLVGYNQSLTTFDYDGYRELQPHVNFPYRALEGLSPEAVALQRGNILFTEMNHGFIGEPGDQNAAAIAEAIGDRAFWADDTKAARTYGSDLALFNEYMNWGLVSLYHYDRMNEADRAISRGQVERMMVNNRGFNQFVPFNEFLVNAYANRAEGETLADLYPDIIAWFAAQSAAAPAAPAQP